MQIAAEYVDIETGKGADALDRRPQLAAALAAAKKAKCSPRRAVACVIGSKSACPREQLRGGLTRSPL